MISKQITLNDKKCSDSDLIGGVILQLPWVTKANHSTRCYSTSRNILVDIVITMCAGQLANLPISCRGTIFILSSRIFILALDWKQPTIQLARGAFCSGVKQPDVKPTTDLHLISRVRICGAILLIPPPLHCVHSKHITMRTLLWKVLC